MAFPAQIPGETLAQYANRTGFNMSQIGALLSQASSYGTPGDYASILDGYNKAQTTPLSQADADAWNAYDATSRTANGLGPASTPWMTAGQSNPSVWTQQVDPWKTETQAYTIGKPIQQGQPGVTLTQAFPNGAPGTGTAWSPNNPQANTAAILGGGTGGSPTTGVTPPAAGTTKAAPVWSAGTDKQNPWIGNTTFSGVTPTVPAAGAAPSMGSRDAPGTTPAGVAAYNNSFQPSAVTATTAVKPPTKPLQTSAVTATTQPVDFSPSPYYPSTAKTGTPLKGVWQ